MNLPRKSKSIIIRDETLLEINMNFNSDVYIEFQEATAKPYDQRNTAPKI